MATSFFEPTLEEILLDIHSIALSGDGVARHEGLVFFVEGALPGEQVRAKVVKRETNLVRAQAIEILRRSPERVDPPCPYFGRCGGCVFQHLAYGRQLETKRLELEQMFVHLGGFRSVVVAPIIPSPKVYHYRNTVAMSVRNQRGEIYLGFIEKDNQSFIPVDHCAIAEERINELLPHVKQRFKECIPPKKWCRTSQVMIRIGEEGKFHTSMRGHAESSRFLTATVCGRKFRYGGASFFQTNFFQLDALVQVVRGMLEPEKDARLLDLYCGAGLFACCLADGYGEVIGTEESEEAVAVACENAKANGIENSRFVSGKTEDLLTSSDFSGGKLHVVIDPPRIGLKKEAVQGLLNTGGIKRLIYVSCNPATLIRDLKLLSPKFNIAKVQPLDMFPHTKHLEAVTLLLPNSASAAPS